MCGRMPARQGQKRPGNTYNLQNRVEIPIELQVSDKGALLNDFSAQPTLGQVLPSWDTDSTGSSIDFNAVFVKDWGDSGSETSVKRLDFRKSERAPFSNSAKFMPCVYYNHGACSYNIMKQRASVTTINVSITNNVSANQ